MNVVLRCDASADLGLGHLSRCLNLAREVRSRGGQAWFVMRRLSPDLTDMPSDAGHQVTVVESGRVSCDLEDQQAVKAALDACSANWVVVDHYGADAQYLAELHGRWRTCVLDDLGDRDLTQVDLIVNPGTKVRYPSSSSLLQGARYALLHPVFARKRELALAARAQRYWRPPSRFLVCLGGAGAAGVTLATIQEIKERTPTAEVRAVFGPGHFGELPRCEWPGVEVLPRQTAEQLAEHMLWADHAVGTPSTIAWELSCLGLLACLIVTARNQERVAEELGGFVPVESSTDGIAGALERELACEGDDRRARASRWAALCDGQGAQRTLSWMEQQSQQDIGLRRTM
jgi:UDP-2,4-diacetamido-2,4,6-trideoxy-beta-L-altropyranose hydrolase